MKTNNSVFVPGLWFNPNGRLAQTVSEHSSLLRVLGLNTIDERVDTLIHFLEENPVTETIVGHSAGALVVAHAINRGLIPNRIQNIVLMNSAPFPGVMFGPTQLVTRTSVKYLPKLTMLALANDSFMMSDEDNRRLLGIGREDLGDVVPDSARFVLSAIRNQFRFQWRYPFTPAANLMIVNASQDDMVGRDMAKRLDKWFFYKDRDARIIGGHMDSVINYSETLKILGLL